MFVISAVLMDNTYTKVFRTLHMRVFCGSFAVGIFILTSAYSNILISFMGKPLVSRRIQTIAEITEVCSLYQLIRHSNETFFNSTVQLVTITFNQNVFCSTKHIWLHRLSLVISLFPYYPTWSEKLTFGYVFFSRLQIFEIIFWIRQNI